MTKRSKTPTSSMAFEQAEKACSKVIYAGETLIDLTADTVSAEHLEEGYTAHDRKWYCWHFENIRRYLLLQWKYG